MAISLYDVSVSTFLQALGAVNGFLAKGAEHCQANGIDLDEVVATSLHPDMFPFRFQVVSVWHHSLGAIKGVKAGKFTPPPDVGELDYAGLQKLVTTAQDELGALSRDEVEALEGGDVVFEFGQLKLPFVAEDFLRTFSLPNFFFHATTAYDILRMKGVPLGKRDFMGAMRLKT